MARARTPATDEVLRRVGRNLVIFQQVEHVLKRLMAHARFEAPASQMVARSERHVAEIDKMTMGSLANGLADKVLSPSSVDNTRDVVDEIWLRFKFTVESDAQDAARLEAELKELVSRRNELVHHFLPRWPAANADDVDPVLEWLDEQREAAVAMLERLRGWSQPLEASLKAHANFLSSEEGARQIELLSLRGSRLIGMLGEVALATPRADGWTLLSTAGLLIKQHAPEELQNLRKRFGVATLKGVLTAAELFDLGEETSSGGGTRTIFRINSGWRLERLPDDAWTWTQEDPAS
jgi:hypothetical protein